MVRVLVWGKVPSPHGLRLGVEFVGLLSRIVSHSLSSLLYKYVFSTVEYLIFVIYVFLYVGTNKNTFLFVWLCNSE